MLLKYTIGLLTYENSIKLEITPNTSIALSIPMRLFSLNILFENMLMITVNFRLLGKYVFGKITEVIYQETN